MKRREFLKGSLAVTTLAGLTATVAKAAAPVARTPRREYYELRIYRLASGAKHDVLDAYLSNAAIPAWNRIGVKPVGVFAQQERKAAAAPTEIRDDLAIVVLLPYQTAESFVNVGARIQADQEYRSAAAQYFTLPKTNPPFERVDSWFHVAFSSIPRLELPAFSREKKPRMFEIRTYESYSEAKALGKVEMFNTGETQLMRDVGLAPVFFGQGLIGSNLPHLTYMLSAENEAAHKEHWDAFIQHPTWKKMKDDPQWADTVSKIYNRFLVPKPCSQI